MHVLKERLTTFLNGVYLPRRPPMTMKMPPSGARSEITKTTPEGIAIHDRVEDMPGLMLGPFVRTEDGAILGVDERSAFLSGDQGRTWTEHPLFGARDDILLRPERALIRTKTGTIILAFENESERNWTWSDELGDAPGAIMPTYATRSTDGGRTWQDCQKLHDDWTGAIRNMIETRDGRVVFTTMKMLHNPGRHSVITYATDDDGKTWRPSNLIDLGGAGHHGGVTESTIVELRDGRIMMLLRTNWGQFWLAYSTDGGGHWHPMGPSGIDASSAPGLLKRLASGRIALFWNRLYPEGKTSYPLSGGNCIWSATPVSNHRGELALSFSEDECATWSQPVIIARNPGSWLSYPYAFEAQPGELWVTTMQGGLRVKLLEEDFAG